MRKYPIRVGDVVRISGYTGPGADRHNNLVGSVVHTNTPANTYMVSNFKEFPGFTVIVSREQMFLFSKQEYPELYI